MFTTTPTLVVELRLHVAPITLSVYLVQPQLHQQMIWFVMQRPLLVVKQYQELPLMQPALERVHGVL